MAISTNSDPISRALRAVVVLLRETGETSWAAQFEAIAERLQDHSDSETSRQQSVREILRLYGGMGSFEDLVLQDAQGVRPEQRKLASLRHALFEEARQALG